MPGIKTRWQHGIALNEKLIATNGKCQPDSGAEGVEMLLEREAKFSALVASNEDMAIGAMKALHERGVAVPEQVSVIDLMISLRPTPFRRFQQNR